MKRAISMLAVGVTVLALALPARASTSQVDMTDAFTFDPTPISVGLGDTVLWKNTTDFTNHTATQNAGFFNTGTVGGGGSASKAFKFGGTFRYHCIFHGTATSGMRGNIKVLIQWLNEGPQHPGDVQRVRIASEKAPDPLALDVQMRMTGDDTWTPFKQKIKNAVVNFTPTDAGTYEFRSRLHRLSNNKVSGWSPATTVVIDPA